MSTATLSFKQTWKREQMHDNFKYVRIPKLKKVDLFTC